MFVSRTAFVLLLAAGVYLPIAVSDDGGRPQARTARAAGQMGMMGMSQKEHVGKMLFFDTNLSSPAGQSCASCHHPMAGFADPNHSLPVSRGAVTTRFGGRNSPTAAYQALAPVFRIDASSEAVGGQFWDGRAADLVEQAKGPFLNPLEMNNPSVQSVVTKVSRSMYASMFRSVYGSNVFKKPDVAFQCIADAIAAYEKSVALNSSTSKYDQFLQGQAALTAQEQNGLALFTEAGCVSCHPTGNSASVGLFTTFRYHNLGLPKNTAFAQFFPQPDLGLANTTKRLTDKGKMKIPTLRNVAVTAPYGHNGVFTTLKSAVHFMNTRDVPGAWDAPEVNANLTNGIGDLKLSESQETDIVAFLNTLTDSSMGGGGMGGGGRHGR